MVVWLSAGKIASLIKNNFVQLLRSSWFLFLLGIIIVVMILNSCLHKSSESQTIAKESTDEEWHAPDINLLPHTDEGDLIRYGRDLIVNTSTYFGPKGVVVPITNGMNCQNCHIEAGIIAFGNSFAAVASTYPKFRDRSGRVESIEFRIKECMERSLNGKSVDSLSKEMKAMVAYFKWLGKDVKKGVKPVGSGIVEIPFINRACNPQNGKIIFENSCQRCHGNNGEGIMFPDSTGYIYPPLWGPHSFNVSAGLYRISRLASFIKYNMPFGPTQLPPQLTDEEAWDVAAFIISQPRDEKRFPYDWPKIGTKPVDYPYGPYTDAFSEQQHKYGPFIPIKEAREKSNKGLK
jgi:thiosulfate dehydrogenase